VIIVVVAAFLVSVFTSMAGVSGAFLLLPFQISVLGFTSPAASATNLFYNLLATPGGVYRYAREGRLLWPLAVITAVAAVPGVLIGAILRSTVLADVKVFKAFVGVVLLYLGLRILTAGGGASECGAGRVRVLRVGRRVEYEFLGRVYSLSAAKAAAVSFVVGVVGGAYGVGGGSLLAPIYTGVFRLPVYTTAGVTLFATFTSSIFGVASYCAVGHPPDWPLGLSLGVGGFAGMYLGARLQQRLPERLLRMGLSLLTLAVAAAYLLQLA